MGWILLFLLCFTDEGFKAQRGKATCLSHTGTKWQSQGLSLDSLIPEPALWTEKKRSGCIYLVYFFSYLFDQGILFHALPLAISEKTFQNILIRVIRVNGEGTPLQEQEGGGTISPAVGRRREGIEAAWDGKGTPGIRLLGTDANKYVWLLTSVPLWRTFC